MVSPLAFGECCEWPPHIAFSFLYLGGLERRALVDEKSIASVFGQVLHLRDYYDRSTAATGLVDRGFEATTTAFLWHLLVRFPATFSMDFVRAVFDQSIGDANEEHLAAVLSWCASRGLAMPAWLAYELTALLPEAKRSVVLREPEVTLSMASPSHSPNTLWRFILALDPTNPERARACRVRLVRRDR